MKVIIYGLGSGRQRIEKYLKQDHEIIGYSDSFFNGDSYNNKRYYKINELIKVEFNYIIISVGDYRAIEKIYNNLKSVGISEDKIIKFYKIYTRVTNLYKGLIDKEAKDYKSIVLGISYSWNGILKKNLKYKPLKLCAPSQDLYYNLKKLQMYKKYIKQCKCCIIELYRYTYFNYDVSLSNNALNYIGANDFWDDIHNLKYKNNFYEILDEYKSEYEIFDNLFDMKNIDVVADYIESGSINPITYDISELNHMAEVEIQNLNMKKSNIQENKFENTIQENILIFKNILKLLYLENPEIKIYALLTPLYVSEMNIVKEVEDKWKKIFFDILKEIQKEYEFTILNFQYYKDISEDFRNYSDTTHLNYYGAKKFTELLNKYID